MTRDHDTTVDLDERTLCANTVPGTKILISLHGNASSNPSISGIETFYMDSGLFTTKLAHMPGHEKNSVAEYKKWLADQSKILAHSVHKQLLSNARNWYTPTDRKVKQQAGQVLFGNMPSILIECGFLSHPQEGTLLAKEEYQTSLSASIVRGVTDFFTRNFA